MRFLNLYYCLAAEAGGVYLSPPELENGIEIFLQRSGAAG